MEVLIKISIGDNQPGSVIELSDSEAKSLIRQGFAELPPKKTATKKQVEKPAKDEETEAEAEDSKDETPTTNLNERSE